jgi:hypothetical protein
MRLVSLAVTKKEQTCNRLTPMHGQPSMQAAQLNEDVCAVPCNCLHKLTFEHNFAHLLTYSLAPL